MPNFSIRSLMFLFVYFAICASIYITQNLAAGWAVVIATAVLIVTSTMYAFRNNDTFALGFSVFATMSILICFGCSFDTSRNFKGWNFQPTIFHIMRFGSATPELESFGDPKNQRFAQHTLFRTERALRAPNDTSTPSYRNALSLFACLAAALMGLIGGFVFRIAVKPRAG